MKQAKGRKVASRPAKDEAAHPARLRGIFLWAEALERRLESIEDRITAIETSAPMLRAAMDKLGTRKKR